MDKNGEKGIQCLDDDSTKSTRLTNESSLPRPLLPAIRDQRGDWVSSLTIDKTVLPSTPVNVICFKQAGIVHPRDTDPTEIVPAGQPYHKVSLKYCQCLLY
jgi:hypothetical protein